jgi:thiol:disulfide interchange protein
MIRFACFTIIGLALGLQATAHTQEKSAAPVNLRVVNYKELGDEIAKHKDKVVLIDFWYTT